MLIGETFKSSLISLKANKIRSFLTMLGVIIGVFSVVTLVSVGIGIENFVTEQFAGLGSNLVIVAPGKVDFADDPAKALSRNKLSDKHVKLIETHAGEFIEAATPSLRLDDTLSYKTNSYQTTVIGGNYKALDIFNFEIGKGRRFTKSDESSNSKVVILGYLVAEELFGGIDPLGKKVGMGGDSYEVIGVFKKKGSDFDDRVVAPYTAVEKTFDIKNYTSIGTKIKEGHDVDVAIRQLEFALLRDLNEDEFTVISQQEILGSITNVLQILTTGLGAIAGISLFVGGIGIMNIMLVTVTERTREIGLRKAVGATSRAVGLQFLTEAVFLSVTGGLIGVFLGFIASKIANNYIKTALPFSAVFVAFFFALTVGVIFGTYPALKASKKDPIEALRFE